MTEHDPVPPPDEDLIMVRRLLTAAPPAPGTVAAARARLGAAAGERTGWRRHRVRLTAAAAAVVLLAGGTAYGVNAGLTGSAVPAGSGKAATAALTAVTGCRQLMAAAGTLVSIHGRALTIRSRSGRTAKVTVTANPLLNISSHTLSLVVADGRRVLVAGALSGHTMAAGAVALPPSAGGHFNLQLRSHPSVNRFGTVSGWNGSSFTLTTADGTRLRVTTAAATAAIDSRPALSQFRTGVPTIALGQVQPDGTLSAVVLLQMPKLPGPGQTRIVTPRGCSARAVATAYLTTG